MFILCIHDMYFILSYVVFSSIRIFFSNCFPVYLALAR